MANLIDIQAQIEKLQKQATEIRSREFDLTLKDIRSKMRAFGITLSDLRDDKRKLQGSKKSKGVVSVVQVDKKQKRQVTVKVAPKFKGPGGEVWSGRGLMPRWLSALVEQGRTRDEFAI